jgi:phospholipase/carboxylesterase
MSLKYNKRIASGIEVIEVPGHPQGGHIVLFHGFGANGFDLVPLSEFYTCDPKPTWYFPTGPLTIDLGAGHEGRAWFPIHFERLRHSRDIEHAFPDSLEKIRVKVEQMIAALEIPLSKLIVGGFSQGAVLATELALHSFQRLAGLLIFSGILIHKEEWEKLTHAQAGLPFFQSHGDHDSLLPLQKAEALTALLTKGGLKGELHAFKGGHEIPTPILKKMEKWLEGFFKTH